MAGRERRVEPLEADDAPRRHTIEATLQHAVLDPRQSFAQDLDQPDRLVLGLGHRTDRRDRVEDALDRRRLEADHGRVRIELPDRVGDLAVAHRAHGAQLLGQDQVGVRGGERVKVELVDGAAAVDGGGDSGIDLAAARTGGRADVGGHHRDRGRLGRVVALVRPADQLVAQAESEDDLRRRGQQ